ncbi:MAG TPA: cyclic nucleotide-binding domain-containing protein [Pyrinomonadaceae bacterium]|nr:cyclic nucleotide-binding domain-containing protein [Pyrinomonadaceae bacterium]
MPRELTKRREILDAVGRVEIISDLLERQQGHFTHELDLEVIAYGRNYNGKKVGPYVRLLVYEPGEEVVRQGDWGGNTFFIPVEGKLDVSVSDGEGGEERVGEISAGVSFGEMSVLAGVPRNATVRAALEGSTVLEVTRPALRLLRKLPRFGRQLDQTYRKHGLGRTLAEVRQVTGDVFDDALIERLGRAARFVVYGKHHVLFREGDPVDRVYFVRDGWVRRVSGHADAAVGVSALAAGLDAGAAIDFLGAGNCLGLEGVAADTEWAYTATVLQRTEVFEVSIPHLRADPSLRDAVERAFRDFSDVDEDPRPAPAEDRRATAATEREIATGVIDGTNLLVMDMDKCVRCGNCSLACHKVHGQSRLLRRGIHIERPARLGGNSAEHVLSPSVCMHCQDPECLTGCPTGAIGRFEGGQIDINPQTCIGCGDCATQCPYNAISMIPRRASAPQPPSWRTRASALLKLAPPQMPASVTETENLLAAKCNLCDNTPMNPKSARGHRYSCEENCPTGALVRVNPREYFAEAGARIGLVYRDRTHAIGRNIHKRDTPALLWHVFGILLTLAVAFAFARWLMRTGLDELLGASSWLTIRWLTGFVGLAALALVMTYPVRKQIYRRRAGPLRYWTLMHVYAGLVAGVVLLMHGGRSTGGLLTSLLMVSFDLTILTGLLGVACYLVLPRVMTSIEGEPLLVEDLRARRDELREQLGRIGAETDASLRELVARRVRRRFLSLPFLLRQYVRREDLKTLLAEAREEFEAEAAALPGTQSRRTLLEAVETAVTLRRVESLVYLHQLLKLWLAPHVVATSLMLALMIVHIIQVVFFAVR